MIEYPAYRFSNLETYTTAEIALLNRARNYLAGGEQTHKIFKAIGGDLLVFDIFDNQEIEISLLVKPAGDVGKPQYFRFTQQLIGLGRSLENQVALKSPLVSKKHAHIERKGVEFFLKDLNSNNGTQLNGVKLNAGSEVTLRNDDIIKIDPFDIVVGLPQEIVRKPLVMIPGPVRVRKESMGAGQLYVFFQILPAGQTGVFMLESQVARWMVQKILTGHRESPLTPWTEIETGLLEYLASKILSTINPQLKDSRLLIQSVENEEQLFKDWLAGQQSVIEMSFETRTEIGSVFSFLCLPESLLSQASVEAPVAAFLERAEWLRKLRYDFTVDLGVSFLSADQIGLLESGDIILMDRTQVLLEDGKPAGKIEMRCGQLKRGVMLCSLHCEESDSKLTVESLYQEGLKSMTEASKKSEAQSGGEGVISSIEIPVIVEFARTTFTLEEISAMKDGQIIEIKKSQAELVDLSVDGKIIASGKLVDVEGKLGVRILKIIK